MISIKNLTKIYDTPAGPITVLDGINLTIQAGEIFGIIGKSGAGKSTLLRCINLLESPTQGQIFIDNKDVTQLSKQALRQLRHHVGMIFQHFNLLRSRTVYENIALPLQLVGKNKQEIKDIIESLLELTGLTEKRDIYPSQLSGGQKQRVAIARALANRPKMLLCDEATSALDPQTTASILNLLEDINKKLNITIVLITHEMDVIKTICDKVAVLEDGKVIEEGPIQQLFSNPQHITTKSFVTTALKATLPESIQERLQERQTENSYPLWRIAFYGHAASEPVIAHLIQKLNIDINILQANIDYIKQEPIGTMVVEVDSVDGDLDKGMKYLLEKNIQVEVLGYVPRYVASPI